MSKSTRSPNISDDIDKSNDKAAEEETEEEEQHESINLITPSSEEKVKSRFGNGTVEEASSISKLQGGILKCKKRKKKKYWLHLIKSHLTFRYFFYTFTSFAMLQLSYHYLLHHKELTVKQSGLHHHKIISNPNYDEIITELHLQKNNERDPIWCLRGPKDEKCTCDNPFVAKGRSKIRHWEQAQHFNKDDLFKAAVADANVLFLGDSITEEWKGTRYRFPVENKKDIPAVFEKLFTRKGGGSVEGIPLGISGDTAPNVLWRIQNGELPDFFNPDIIWLLIGTNDFGNTWCTADIVSLGVRRIIDEIRERKANSTLVVNSILPRTFHRKGYVNQVQMFKHKKHQRMGPNLWKEIQFVNQELQVYIQDTIVIVPHNITIS